MIFSIHLVKLSMIYNDMCHLNLKFSVLCSFESFEPFIESSECNSYEVWNPTNLLKLVASTWNIQMINYSKKLWNLIWMLKYGFCNKVILERWNSVQLNTITTHLSSLLGVIAIVFSNQAQKWEKIFCKSVQLVRVSSFRNDFVTKSILY